MLWLSGRAGGDGFLSVVGGQRSEVGMRQTDRVRRLRNTELTSVKFVSEKFESSLNVFTVSCVWVVCSQKEG